MKELRSGAGGIFSGIRVLSVARQIAAPFATYQLAMHGADVLMIENPKEMDSGRTIDDGNGLSRFGMGQGFFAQGANKRSMYLDISTPTGQDIFRELAARSDVLVENLVAGRMGRYGLGYGDLAAGNPRLIYCSVTGFGQQGPLASRPAIDGAMQAMSGLMSLTGTPETGPLKVGFLMTDYATGYAAALSIASALFHRERTGEGQYIDCAMLDTALTMAGTDVSNAATTGQMRALTGNWDGRFISDVFRCGEGSLSIAATTDVRRHRLWTAIGRLDIPLDPRFCSVAAMAANRSELNREIERTLRLRSAIAWEEVMADAGVPAMAVRSLAYAIANPQVAHRGLLYRFEHDDELGCALSVPKAPYQFSKTPAVLREPPPREGEHTCAILRELGYETDIEWLAAQKIIKMPSSKRATAPETRRTGDRA